MVSLFREVQRFLHFEEVATDNAVFRLHYKATVGLLMTFSILLGAKQYFGDPIDCTVDGVQNNIMDTYCWITGTYTVLELTQDNVQHEVVHPGVGYFDKRIHTKLYHKYYQWVPLVLAVTAMFFYAPRFLWKACEGGTMSHVCKGMKFPNLEEDRDDERTVDRQRAEKLFHFFMMSRKRNNLYSYKFFACEMLNMINVVTQWFVTNEFLNGGFVIYGHQFLNYMQMNMGEENMHHYPKTYKNPADVVFPKVSMCTFKMHGTSANPMTLNGLCVLPLNILNEKIYYIIWFWYVFLMLVTFIGFIYRCFAMSTTSVRKMVLKSYHGLFERTCVDMVCANCSVGDWFLLRQMSKNVDSFTFSNLIMILNEYYSKGVEIQRSQLLKGRRKSKVEKLFNPKMGDTKIGFDNEI